MVKKTNRLEIIELFRPKDELILMEDERFRVSTSLSDFKKLMKEWFSKPLGVFDDYHLIEELVTAAEDYPKPILLTSFFEAKNFHIRRRIMFITADLLEKGACNVYSKRQDKDIQKIELRRPTNNPSAPFPTYLGRMFGYVEESKFIEILYVQDRSG